MSEWNHSICDECWIIKNPRRQPARVLSETCCYCGKNHHSGIYVRGDPKETPCDGKGEEHEHE